MDEQSEKEQGGSLHDKRNQNSPVEKENREGIWIGHAVKGN